MKQLITLKPKGVNQETKIVHNNQTITNPREITSAFNKLFASIGEKLRSWSKMLGRPPSPTTMLSKRYLNCQEKGLFMCSQSFQH